MKILVFADPHGSQTAFEKVEKLAKKKKVNYIACVGDITIFEQGLAKIIEQIDKWNIPILMIHGNHEERKIMEHLCKVTRNIRFIHKKAFRVDNVLFLGYGGGGFATEDPEFDLLAKSWKKKIKKDDKVIMVTHQAPYGAVDEVLDMHAGSQSITKFIIDNQPKFCFVGHLHETFDMEEKIGKTRVINPGPYGKVFEV
ncbi:metallophosphoesterase [Thermoproteota archaeon]